MPQNIIKPQIIYNKLPDFQAKDKIIRLNKPLSIKHCPEDKHPETVKEFMEVCKDYVEVGLDTKRKNGFVWINSSYRCLFSNTKDANKAYEKVSNMWEKQKQQHAMAQFKKEAWRKELGLIEENEDETEEE